VGVPVSLNHLDGMDSLLSIVQMPAGVPVATVSIDGAKNAGLLALKILGTEDRNLQKKLDNYREELQKLVEEKNQNLKSSL
jgi:5-(carboxyamino)imidazole ribonucleotide mutase